MSVANPLVVRALPGLQAYPPVWEAMQHFSAGRHAGTADEVWLLEHEPIYTLGQAADLEHVLEPGDIPVLKTDRGGQVTYHGPGQLVAYCMVNLSRRGLMVRSFVALLEQAVLQVLKGFGIHGCRRAGAPGVYVGAAKIAALGLRVRKGCSFHGVAVNVDPDLEPFARIHPCGLPDLEVTSLARLLSGPAPVPMMVGQRLVSELARLLDCRLVMGKFRGLGKRTLHAQV